MSEDDRLKVRDRMIERAEAVLLNVREPRRVAAVVIDAIGAVEMAEERDAALADLQGARDRIQAVFRVLRVASIVARDYSRPREHEKENAPMKMRVSMSLDELHQIVLDALNVYNMKIEQSHVNEREKVMYFSLVSDAGTPGRCAMGEDLRDADREGAFTDANGIRCRAGMRVEYVDGRRGLLVGVEQDGDAGVRFDGAFGIDTVKWRGLCAVS